MVHHALQALENGVTRLPLPHAGLSDAAVRALVPRWHYAMLNDSKRNRAFAEAIAATSLQGRMVLDIGAGSGLLSILAARAGAEEVYACEALRPVAVTAREVVALHQLEHVVRILPKYSFDITIGTDMPRRADVLITETVDCGLVGEGLLKIVQHARAHLLRPGARILPRRATLHAALLESRDVHALNYVSEAEGVDVTLFNRFSTTGYFPVRLDTWEHRLLGESVEIFAFDLENDDLGDQEKAVFMPAHAGGIVHGVVFWFDLELCPGISICNKPGASKGHWMQAVQCFEKPIELGQRSGLPVNIALRDHSILTVLSY